MIATKPHLLWLRTSTTSTPPPGGGTPGALSFVVIDDTLYITDITGIVYEAPVTFVGLSTESSGTIIGEDDTLSFHYLGGEWVAPATIVTPTGVEGQALVLNDIFYVTLGGATYSMPVTQSNVPGNPPTSEASLVTIDGRDYVRIVFPDGEVRYEEVHETPTPDFVEGTEVDTGIINVLAFGVVADDTGDQGPPIQAVINNAPLGATIFFPPGNYKVLTPVNTLAKRLHFRGAGAHCVRFNFRPATPSWLFTIPANSDNVYFSDLSMVGSGNPGTNIRMGAIKQLSDAPTNTALTECFIDRCNFDTFTDDVLFFNAIEYARISQCRFLSNADITAAGGSGTGTATCLRTGDHANAVHLYKCRFSQNDRLILAPGVTLFDISNNSFEYSGVNARAGWTADYFIDIGTGLGQSRGLSFRNNYVEGERTSSGKAFMRLRDCLAPRISGNTFTGWVSGASVTHNFIEFGTNTICPRVACNWFEEVLTTFMSVTGSGGKVRAWDNTFVQGAALLMTKSSINTRLAPSSGAFELDGDFINRAVTVDAGANAEGFNVRGTGQVSGKIQSQSTSGSRSAFLDLEVANTGASDPAGSVHFRSGYGLVAQVDGLTNNVGNGGQLKLRTADTSLVMQDRMTIDSAGSSIFSGAVAIGSGTAIAKVLSATASVNFASMATLTENTQTITVTGVATTNTPSVALGWAASLEAGIVVMQAWVSAANTVSIRVRNVTTGTIDPAAVTVRATVTSF